MTIDLVLKDVELGRYARERIDHKLAKTVERYHRDIPVRVSLEESKGLFRARVITSLNGRELVGQHESRSKLEAVDEAIVKFDRQIIKFTDRFGKRPKGRRTAKEVPEPTDGVLAEVDLDAALMIDSFVLASR